MRRNPCGIRELRRSSNGGYADVFCRVERAKRKHVIEDRIWGELKQFHRVVLHNLPALTL